jgi:radical SAM superfamily enzyme YgiQ (UPF0313 family)
MRVALVLAPFCSPHSPPVSLALLASCLRQAHYKVSCFDLNVMFFHYYPKKDRKRRWAYCQLFWYNKKYISKFLFERKRLVDSFVMQILKDNTYVVGFSIYFSNLIASLEIAHRLKKKAPLTKIIFGGPHFDSEKTAINLLKNTHIIDAIIIGEAEITLPKLLHIIKQKEKVDFCPGAIIKKKGKIINCGKRDVIDNLNQLPFLDYSDFPFSYYLLEPILPKYKTLELNQAVGISTSRGCANRCIFCVDRSLKKGYRSMAGERIFSEVMHQQEVLGNNKVKRIFYFADSLTDVRPLSRFADLIIENRVDIYWSFQTAISSYITRDLLEKIKKAGCVSICYGIESGSQKILNRMKKPFKLLEAERVIKDTHETGISVKCNFIVGFPGERKQDFIETINFIVRNSEYIDLIAPHIFTLNRRTEIFKNYKEFNILSDDWLFWETGHFQDTYPQRLKRLEELYQCAIGLNIRCCNDLFLFRNIYNLPLDLVTKNFFLGLYYLKRRNYLRGAKYLLNYWKEGELFREIVKNYLNYTT